MKSWMLCLLMLTVLSVVPGPGVAGDFQGTIIKSRGDVVIRDKHGQQRKPSASNYVAVTNEIVDTHDGGRAVVKFTNGSLTVIGENSSLGIEKPTLFAHLKGKILFAFMKNTGPTRRVRTPSAVFGVRATTFVVGQDEKGETLSLKEGLIHVEAQKGAFEIHKSRELSELGAFKAEIEKGVKDMKREGEAFIQKEKKDFVAFKKSFLVQPEQSIRIQGNRVEQNPMAASDKAVFEDFEAFAGEFLGDFKE